MQDKGGEATRQTFTFLVVLFIVFGLRVYAHAISFTDGTFNDADWTATKIQDTSSGSQSSFTVQQVSTGGNPAAYREVSQTFGFNSPGMRLRVAHLRDGALYNPALNGAITTIDFSFDLNWLNPPLVTGGVGYEPLLFQDNTYYRGPNVVITANAWENKNLQASSHLISS